MSLSRAQKESIQLPEIFFFCKLLPFSDSWKKFFSKNVFFHQKTKQLPETKKNILYSIFIHRSRFWIKGRQPSQLGRRRKSETWNLLLCNKLQKNKQELGRPEAETNECCCRAWKAEPARAHVFKAWSFNEPIIELFSSLSALRKAFKLSYGLIDQKKKNF